MRIVRCDIDVLVLFYVCVFRGYACAQLYDTVNAGTV